MKPPQSAVEQAHRHLSQLIHLHGLPSRRLPSVRELSRGIGVSVPSVLLALKRLEAEGFISIRRGRTGVEVRELDPAARDRRLDWLDENRLTVLQMAHLRAALEPRIARILAV